MIKYIVLLSFLNVGVNPVYSGVESIECYQSNSEEKRFTFNFKTDYINVYDFFVNIKLYKKNDELDKRYTNNLKVIGNRKASTKIFIESDIQYVLIEIICDQKILVKDARFELYSQDNCYLNKENKKCNQIYLSKFEKGEVVDKSMDFLLMQDLFDKYLATNIIDLKTIKFQSKYDFSFDTIYLINEKKIEGYELVFNEKYIFPLTVREELSNNYTFQLLNNYYVSFLPFIFKENYSKDTIEIDCLVLPFNNDVREYEFQIVIESFINIYISFNVATNGGLYGECFDSKFCLKREKL